MEQQSILPRTEKRLNRPLIIIGASGHGRVIVDIAAKDGYDIKGFLDDDPEKTEQSGYPILGKVEEAKKYLDTAQFFIAIGDNETRKKVNDKLEQYGKIYWAVLIHPTAIIGDEVEIDPGTVIMANTVINPGTHIGRHCILNTAAVVEHDNILEPYVHISSGATLTGTVHIGTMTHIGAGVVIRNTISICELCEIGVGAAVVKDITEPGVYVGVPAKKLR